MRPGLIPSWHSVVSDSQELHPNRAWSTHQVRLLKANYRDSERTTPRANSQDRAASRRGRVGTPKALAVSMAAVLTGWLLTARVRVRAREVVRRVSAKGTPTRASAWSGRSLQGPLTLGAER